MAEGDPDQEIRDQAGREFLCVTNDDPRTHNLRQKVISSRISPQFIGWTPIQLIEFLELSDVEMGEIIACSMDGFSLPEALEAIRVWAAGEIEHYVEIGYRHTVRIEPALAISGMEY